MKTSSSSRAVLGTIVFLLAIGCGGDDTVVPMDDGGADDADGADATALDGNLSDANSEDGDAAVDVVLDGAADTGPLAEGKSGVSLVSAGTTCTSPRYRMVVSLGQGPGGNVTSNSAGYQLRGGVVGATQKP
jgi:hypothetical protein